jgi:hypothetical protein
VHAKTLDKFFVEGGLSGKPKWATLRMHADVLEACTVVYNWIEHEVEGE